MDVQTEKLLERGGVLLVPHAPARLTDHGKRFFSRRLELVDKHWDTIWQITRLALEEIPRWPAMLEKLRLEGVPTAATSGLSNYSQLKALDYLSGKTTTAFAMASSWMSLTTGTAPTVNTTGANGDNAGQYGGSPGYSRLSITLANYVAASGTNPATTTYSSVGAVTFGGCTSGTATETGFCIVDNGTVNSGNSYWYGTLASVVISATQTPPTLAQNALTLSLNGT